MPSNAGDPSHVVITAARFDGVAFDLDGVLTNTALVHEAAWKQVFDRVLEKRARLDQQLFVPFSSDDYRQYVDGRPRGDGIRGFLAARGIVLPEGGRDDAPDQETVRGIGRAKNDLFLALLEHQGVETYPDAVTFIGRLRDAGLKIAVVSASRNCAAVLRAARIAHLFDAKVDGVDREALGLRGKPAPDTFLEAARRLRAAPSRIVVVEDALAGVEAGRAGGFGLVLGVSRKGDAQSMRTHGADVIVPDLASIIVGEPWCALACSPVVARATPPVGPPGAPLHPAELRMLSPERFTRELPTDPWTLAYEGFDPAAEGHRETLFTIGNGYLASRGAAMEAVADDVHYPGTYLAGGYNRLITEIAGQPIEHEDLVNWPNWLSLLVRSDGGDTAWFSPRSTELLHYRQELDLRRGLYRRTVRFRDAVGRVTRLDERRCVHMRERHLAALHLRVTAENWSGRLVVRSALDGNVTNAGVLRYRPFNGRHFEIIDAGALGADVVLLGVQTTQSRMSLFEAARTRLYRGDDLIQADRHLVQEAGLVGHEMIIELSQAESVVIEKIISFYTTRDRAIADARMEAITAVSRVSRFADLVRKHSLQWLHLWRRCDLGFVQASDSNHRTQRIVRLHIFHLLQSVSPHTIDLDAGVPARGWTGEAYRGHVFWDELFVFPFLNDRLPRLTRALLLYRCRRLPEARWAAREAGYLGAMFPWQSGSNGREETDVTFLNPRSGDWIRDNTRLQRHVNAAIAYNVWQYYSATDDSEFLYDHGAELMLEIARFWASIAQWNPDRARYEIGGIMGPDEFHDGYPGAENPGLKNNAYTNVMAAWCVERALRLFDILPGERCRELCETLQLDRAELDHWEDISRRIFVPFHGDGIISQFEGYEHLEEFDWEKYRLRYGNIMRLDLILKAEGDTPNRYKLSKQADVLMLFYLFSSEALAEIFGRLGYPFHGSMIPKNIDYYLKRTSHGSTLSGVVHAWVLSRSCRPQSWALFKQALQSDVGDIQGGTTAEGIHLGAMAGTVDLLQRCYPGLEIHGDELWFNPVLPQELSRLSFRLRHRRHSLVVDITQDVLSITSEQAATGPLTVRFRDEIRRLEPGGTVLFGPPRAASA